MRILSGCLSRLLRSRTGDAGETTIQGLRRILDDCGAAAVEFALASIVLMPMLLGVFQMTLALYTYHYISEAAREATRYAIVRGSQCTGLDNCNATSNQIQTYVQGLGYPGITSANLTATTTWLTASSTLPTTWSTCTTNPCNVTGNLVQVVVTYAFPVGIPFVTTWTINMSSTSQMVVSL